jgi:hypothetical protein
MSEDTVDEVVVNDADGGLVGALDDPVDELPAPSLGAALEALLIVAVEPQSTIELAEATRHPVDEVAARLAELSADYAAHERGFALREVAGGWRFYTSAACSGMVERWVLDGQQAKLTQAALETLAVGSCAPCSPGVSSRRRAPTLPVRRFSSGRRRTSSSGSGSPALTISRTSPSTCPTSPNSMP